VRLTAGPRSQDLTDLRLIQDLLHHTGAAGRRVQAVPEWTPLSRRTARRGTGPVWSLVWNHDGTLLATGGQDSIVRVWVLAGSAYAKEVR
jgi:WD40 repeat protein